MSKHSTRSRTCSGRLQRLENAIRRQRTYKTVDDLRRMCQSRSADQRLRGLLAMQWQIAVRGLRRSYFDLARPLIDDNDNDCRWQAMIVIGEYIETDPARVWPIVEHYGQSDDEDMRAAVATVLLEHVLEHHRKQYEKRVQTLARKSPEFKDTYEMCWDLDR